MKARRRLGFERRVDTEAAEQDRQLACYCNNGLTLGLLASSGRQMQTHCRSTESFPYGLRMWLGALDQQTSNIGVDDVRDAEVRIVIT